MAEVVGHPTTVPGDGSTDLGQRAGMSLEPSLNVEQERADIGKVRLAIASIGFLTTAVLMLVVRGPAGWSRAFGLSWYGLFAAAVGLALAALVAAALSRELALKRRLAIVGLSLPALLAVPFLLWTVVTLAPLAD